MDGILKRLSAADSEAENALRVIAFFERLVAARAGIEEIVRSAAQLTGLSAGVDGHPDHPSYACTSHGQKLTADVPRDALTCSVMFDGSTVAVAWLLESDTITSMAEFVVERMAMATEAVFARGASVSAGTADPVLHLLSKDAQHAERSAAARAVNFHIDWPVRVVAMKPELPTSEMNDIVQNWASRNAVEATRVTLDRSVAFAIIHDVGADRELPNPDWSLQVCIGNRVTLSNAFESADSARVGIRLTSGLLGPKMIDYDKLGPLELVARIEPTVARESRLVQQLIFLSQSNTGLAELTALDAFCEHRSLRQASAVLNLHHTSLDHRLKNIERKLGISLSDSGAMFAVSLALQLLRVAAWQD